MSTIMRDSSSQGSISIPLILQSSRVGTSGTLYRFQSLPLNILHFILCCVAGLLPGFYASGTTSSDGSLIASLCPMGWICPGSAPNDPAVVVLSFTPPTATQPIPSLPNGADSVAGKVVSCADAVRPSDSAPPISGLWTQRLGASSPLECCECATCSSPLIVLCVDYLQCSCLQASQQQHTSHAFMQSTTALHTSDAVYVQTTFSQTLLVLWFLSSNSPTISHVCSCW